jgi:hypothetical protein
MPTWTGKEDAQRAASHVPCSIIRFKERRADVFTSVMTGQIEVEAAI